MISFFTSLLSASLVFLVINFSIKKYSSYLVYGLSLIIILLVILLNNKFFAAQTILQVDSAFYTNEVSLKWTTSKISDEYLPKNTKKPKNEKEALSNTQIFSFQQTPIEYASDLISLTGIVLVFIGIISTRKKANHA
jgi:hypothetical protein